MKKLLAFIPLLALMLCGCDGESNRTITATGKYEKVHFYKALEPENKRTGTCYELLSWKDYSDSEQLDLNIKDYGWVLVTANQVMLVNDKCPLCGK